MKTIAALLSFCAISQAATLLPLDSSLVNVKSEHSGQDYSYTIHENRGYAIDPSIHPAIHPSIPVIKTIPQIPGGPGFHGPEPIHMEGNQPEPIRPQSLGKAVPEHAIPEHGVPLGSYPTAYLGYVPVSYQYGYPYGINYPYNLLTYRVA